MTVQDREAPHRRAHPLRWLLAILVGLLLFIPLAFQLLPKFVGGLLGKGSDLPSGWSGENPQTEIVWIPNPRLHEDDPEKNPAAVSTLVEETVVSKAEPAVEETPAIPAVAEQDDATGGQPPAAGVFGPATSSGTPAPGSGPPEGEGRRSPRVLFQEWPSQELLASLSSSGRIRFRLRVEIDGYVSAWEILESFDCDPCLEEAERIVETLRFVPGTLHGDPVVCWVPYSIEFQHNQRR